MQIEDTFLYCRPETIFGILALGFALFTVIANVGRKRWKRILLDAFIYFALFPLWLLLGMLILICFPALVYSWAPGLWFCFGLLLWIAPHGMMTFAALKRRLWPDVLCSLAGIGAIGCLMAFFYFRDIAEHAL